MLKIPLHEMSSRKRVEAKMKKAGIDLHNYRFRQRGTYYEITKGAVCERKDWKGQSS